MALTIFPAQSAAWNLKLVSRRHLMAFAKEAGRSAPFGQIDRKTRIWQIALVAKMWRRKRCTEILKRPVKHFNVLKPHTHKFLSFSIHEKRNKIICIRLKRRLHLTQNRILLVLFLPPNQKPIVHTALVTDLTRIRGGILLILPNCMELYPNKPLPASPKAAQVYSSELLEYLEMHCQKETLPTLGIIIIKKDLMLT